MTKSAVGGVVLRIMIICTRELGSRIAGLAVYALCCCFRLTAEQRGVVRCCAAQLPAACCIACRVVIIVDAQWNSPPRHRVVDAWAKLARPSCPFRLFCSCSPLSSTISPPPPHTHTHTHISHAAAAGRHEGLSSKTQCLGLSFGHLLTSSLGARLLSTLYCIVFAGILFSAISGRAS